MKVLMEPIQGGYRATALALPNTVAEGPTDAEALERLKSLLAGRFAEGVRVIDLDFPGESKSSGDGWSAVFGAFADDEDFDAWQEEIRAARLRADEAEGISPE